MNDLFKKIAVTIGIIIGSIVIAAGSIFIYRTFFGGPDQGEAARIIAAIHENNSRIETRIAEIEGKFGELSSKLESIEGKLSTVSSRISDIRERILGVNSGIQNISDRLFNFVAILGELEAGISDLEAVNRDFDRFLRGTQSPEWIP